jgi:glucose-6-phosphate 1-dehydrogenase
LTHGRKIEGEVCENHVIVLFGATGDLAQRKIIPGLFKLSVAGLLPPRCRIIGSSPTAFALSTDQFRAHARDAITRFGTVQPTGETWDRFEQLLSFVIADPGKPEALVAAVKFAESEIGGDVRRLFHLAIPPSAFADMVTTLGESGLNANARIICEKPFGVDFASACALNAVIARHFDESQVFRIDHFLGKESIDNILALRFANGLFEPTWNRTHVRYVQIDVPETLSVEGRGAFFEPTGTFRYMVVTHLFQVLGFIAMEQPVTLDARHLRDEVNKVFESIRPLDPDHMIRGQYDGYLTEPGVSAHSTTETFVALRTEVENTRWKGVPFYLRTGKCLAESRQVITIAFHEPVMRIFDVAEAAHRHRTNKVVVDFADPGSIEAHFLAKQPGPLMRLESAHMTFCYEDSFAAGHNLEAYEHLLLQAMQGNQTLFTRSDGVERLWEIAEPALRDPPPVRPYAKGSWGPEGVEHIVAPDHWFLPSS